MSLMGAAQRMKHNALVARKRFTAEGRERARRMREGVLMDDSVWVSPLARVEPGARIGPRSWVNQWSQIDGLATIGADVGIALGVYVCCATHAAGPSERRAGDPVFLPTVIEDGCWLGAYATILPGVTVARGCVIAAGAVVTKDTTPDGLYAGVPAKRVKDLPS